MDLGLKGLRALVTGGTRGIGRAVVETLAAEGASVAFCARTPADSAATAALAGNGGTVLGYVADVGDQAALREWVTTAAEALGGVDIVVANVSALAIPDSAENWQRSFEVDMMGTVGVIQAAMPYLEQSPAASIVMISSVSGREVDFAAGPYGVFKAAMIHYAQGLAFQLAAKDIRANSLSPGNTYFPGGVWEQIEQGNPELFAAGLGAESDRADGQAGGDRPRRGVPRQPRGELHHRHQSRGRRRAHAGRSSQFPVAGWPVRPRPSQRPQPRHGQHRHRPGGHRRHREAAVRAEGAHRPPAAAAALAEPAALAEFSQTKAWVSTARGTVASASTVHRTRFSGTASPVSATPSPSSSGERAASNGRQPTASPAAATASCTCGAVRHRRSPYSQPASRLAQLDTVNSAAAVPAAPCSTANAVTEICMAPKKPPIARLTPARTANPGRSSERPPRCAPGRAARRRRGAALRGEAQPAGHDQGGGQHRARLRVPAGAEHADQDRADQEGQLVGQRLQRERGGQRRHGPLVAQQRHPAGRGQRAELGDGGAGQYPARRHQPGRERRPRPGPAAWPPPRRGPAARAAAPGSGRSGRSAGPAAARPPPR